MSRIAHYRGRQAIYIGNPQSVGRAIKCSAFYRSSFAQQVWVQWWCLNLSALTTLKFYMTVGVSKLRTGLKIRQASEVVQKIFLVVLGLSSPTRQMRSQSILLRLLQVLVSPEHKHTLEAFFHHVSFSCEWYEYLIFFELQL